MARVPKSSQIITANRLIDGRVVFYSAGAARWARDVQQAEVFADPTAAEAALKQAEQDVALRLVVDPYPIGVSVDEGLILPSLLRERIRAAGPTVAGAVVA
ncbi:MAG: DUF2849 domain-containing protein [Ancalomicrobiaceae bacterium]|nr:DUF2849 domain-containing protein [Ancalomicrobiaceae bacterium]